MANFLAMHNKRLFAVINIGSGKTTSVNEITQMIGGKTQNIGFRLEPKISLADITLARTTLYWAPTKDLETWIKSQIAQQTSIDR